MDVYEAIKKMRSVRKYLDSPIPFDKIARILDAGHNAPCAGNLQAWRFVVVKTKEKIIEISKNCYDQLWMETAPVLIVICADNTKITRAYGVRGERLYSIQDCALAAMNMMIAAEEEDLSTCFVGAFDERMLKRTLDIPDNARPQAIITLGYPDERPQEPIKTELKDVIYFDKWGNKEDVKEFF
ncbi:nitroreductase family protein, partial [Candidatus Woesearchaeota archaeon]|nr:nitroreductase family protein [Candidatus Woesearchaeota archaeon]